MVSRRLVYQNVSGVTLAINQIADVVDPVTSDFYVSQYNNYASHLKACIITGRYDGVVDGVLYVEEVWRDNPQRNKTTQVGNVLRHADLTYRFDAIATGQVPSTNPPIYTSGGAVKLRFKIIDINNITHYSDYKYVYIDYDGNIYNVLTYGTQMWTIEDYRGIIAKNNSDSFHIFPSGNQIWFDRISSTPVLHRKAYIVGALYYEYGLDIATADINTKQTYGVSDFGFFIPSYDEMEILVNYFDDNTIYPCDVVGKYSVWGSSDVEHSPSYNYTENNSTLFDLYPFGSVEEWGNIDNFDTNYPTISLLISNYELINSNKYWQSFTIYDKSSTFWSALTGKLNLHWIQQSGELVYPLWGSIRLVSDIW